MSLLDKRVKVFFLIAAVFFAGAISSILFLKYNFKRGCDAQYDFVNPALKCREPKYAIKKTGYAELIARIESYISEETGKGNIIGTSIYYRDLVNGPTFGIGAEEKFTPASLLKLPLAISFYKLESEKKGLLQQKVIYEGHKGGGYVQGVPAAQTVTAGQTYLVQELIGKSLIYSDNESTGVLLEVLKHLDGEKDLLTETLVDIGIVPPNSDSDRTVSVRDYGGIFRFLFNASYLSLEDSNAILSLLSRSDYIKGIRAGVPGEVAVAHKFGERMTDDYLQLHDCGIIYFPENPYLLCVMSQGRKLDKLENFLKVISEEVYKEVDSRRL